MRKLHPQIARSRKALADAVISLSLQRGYENLTTRAVTQYAQVGYATFYRHYKSLDDLLTHVLLTAFKEMSARVSQEKSLYDEAVALYTFVREHQPQYRIYLSLPPTHPVRQPLMVETAKLVYARCAQREQTQVPLAVSVDHVIETTNRLILWYLDKINEYTPEQVASMHYDLVVKGIINAVLTPARPLA